MDKQKQRAQQSGSFFNEMQPLLCFVGGVGVKLGIVTRRTRGRQPTGPEGTVTPGLDNRPLIAQRRRKP
jgi:hypothetical protein